MSQLFGVNIAQPPSGLIGALHGRPHMLADGFVAVTCRDSIIIRTRGAWQGDSGHVNLALKFTVPRTLAPTPSDVISCEVGCAAAAAAILGAPRDVRPAIMASFASEVKIVCTGSMQRIVGDRDRKFVVFGTTLLGGVSVEIRLFEADVMAAADCFRGVPGLGHRLLEAFLAHYQKATEESEQMSLNPYTASADYTHTSSARLISRGIGEHQG